MRDDVKSPWKTLLKVGPEEILDAISFTADGKALYLNSSIGRDTAAVVEKDIATGTERVVAASDEVDAGQVFVHPRKYLVEAVAFSPGRTAWKVVDPAVKDDFAGLVETQRWGFLRGQPHRGGRYLAGRV